MPVRRIPRSPSAGTPPPKPSASARHAARTLDALDFAEDLRKSHDELAGRVSELATANRDLAFAQEARARLVSTIAHELNTALTPVAMELHLLREAGLEGLDPRQRHAVEVIGKGTDRLRLLVRDLADASRLHSGALRVRPAALAVADVAREALDAVEAPAREAGVEVLLEVEPGLRVRADPHRVHQVLLNLLTNAIKFTPRGGRVRVKAQTSGAMVRIGVHDTGAGIAAEDQMRLFQPFAQVHEEARERGSGLGLYICRGIVEQHGGRMGCESAGPGQGAMFWFTLPRDVAATTEPLHRTGAGPAA